MNPAVGTARINVSQYPIAMLRYMMYHSSMNGITELNTCQALRHVSGKAYFETIPCHLNFSLDILTPIYILLFYFIQQSWKIQI